MHIDSECLLGKAPSIFRNLLIGHIGFYYFIHNRLMRFRNFYIKKKSVYRSGKVLCTGLRNEHDSYIAARKFARIIQKLGYPVCTQNIVIINVPAEIYLSCLIIMVFFLISG